MKRLDHPVKPFDICVEFYASSAMRKLTPFMMI